MLPGNVKMVKSFPVLLQLHVDLLQLFVSWNDAASRAHSAVRLLRPYLAGSARKPPLELSSAPANIFKLVACWGATEE